MPEALVDAAKRQEIAQQQFSRNSIEDLAFDWSQALTLEGLSSPNDRIARISAVTKADVDRMIRATFDPAHAIVGILQPKGAGEASSSGFGGKESFYADADGPRHAAELGAIARGDSADTATRPRPDRDASRERDPA